MSQQNKIQYTDSYFLSSLVQIQQHIPKKYNPRDYLGGCMRIEEEQTAAFLRDFVNGITIVLPKDYELLQNLLFIARSSGYRPIKKLLPLASKKYDVMLRALRGRQAAAAAVSPAGPDGYGSNQFSILDNKKKMLLMSCTDICRLGGAINQEHNFNTAKIKNKFASFASYRIELVLAGKMPIDPDFEVLLNKHGTSNQINLYNKIINNRVESYIPVQMEPLPQSLQQSQKTTQTTTPTAHRVTEPVKKTEPSKKSGPGLFGRIKQSVKKVVDKVKKPLLVGGIFALSILGGKKIMESDQADNNPARVQTEYTVNQQPKHNIASDSAKTFTIQPQALNTPQRETGTITQTNNAGKSENVANPVLKKSVRLVQVLKNTNPADRNIDADATANKLYQMFGADTYNIILTCVTAPYKLNDMTQFDIKPTTHNMIQYLCNNNLSAKQRADLTAFATAHIAARNYAAQQQLQHQR